MMKTEFTPYLAHVMEPVFKSMQSDDVEWDKDGESDDSDLEEDLGEDDEVNPSHGFRTS